MYAFATNVRLQAQQGLMRTSDRAVVSLQHNSTYLPVSSGRHAPQMLGRRLLLLLLRLRLLNRHRGWYHTLPRPMPRRRRHRHSRSRWGGLKVLEVNHMINTRRRRRCPGCRWRCLWWRLRLVWLHREVEEVYCRSGGGSRFLFRLRSVRGASFLEGRY